MSDIPPVWVICIAYDYGVVDRAGYFTSEEAANSWIANDEHERKIVWDRCVAEAPELYGDWSDQDKEFTPTGLYPVRLELAPAQALAPERSANG